MLKDRIFLSGLILGTWALIKLLEEILPDKALDHLPKPLALYAVVIFVAAMVIHTIWLALAQRRKGFFKTKHENSAVLSQLHHYPQIDILIAAHNEEMVISNTIENLLLLNYPHYTIYIINDHSADSTQKILDKYSALYSDKIKIIHRQDEQIRGKAAAINYALRYSSGELIAVFDADARIEPDFFIKMLPYIDDEKTAAVQSQKRVLNSSVNYLTKLQENEYCLDNYFQCGKDAISGNVELRGNGFLIKRSILEKIGLFDETALTEDLELSSRLSTHDWNIRFCPEAIVLEQAPVSFNGLIRQRRRWTEGSLRRYLSHLTKMFDPRRDKTFTQQFDAFVFLSQFAVPIWLFLDIMSELARYLRDQETHLTTLMLISLAVWLITFVNLIFGIRIYRKFSWRTSIKRAIETNIYFLSVWPLIVLLTVRKILFSRTKGKWHKTERYNDFERLRYLDAKELKL